MCACFMSLLMKLIPARMKIVLAALRLALIAGRSSMVMGASLFHEQGADAIDELPDAAVGGAVEKTTDNAGFVHQNQPGRMRDRRALDGGVGDGQLEAVARERVDV